MKQLKWNYEFLSNIYFLFYKKLPRLLRDTKGCHFYAAWKFSNFQIPYSQNLKKMFNDNNNDNDNEIFIRIKVLIQSIFYISYN